MTTDNRAAEPHEYAVTEDPRRENYRQGFLEMVRHLGGRITKKAQREADKAAATYYSMDRAGKFVFIGAPGIETAPCLMWLGHTVTAILNGDYDLARKLMALTADRLEGKFGPEDFRRRILWGE